MIPTEDDCFDRVPDPLLLLIFNKLRDAKSLTRCLSVSRRFASLISQTDTVFLSIPRRKPSSKSKRKLPVKLLKILVNIFIAKPLNFFHHVIAPNSAPDSDAISYYSADEVLKHFKEVKSMNIELPSQSGDIGLVGRDTLLKWKAEFGDQFKSCVILGATSFQKYKPFSDKFCKQHCHQEGDTEAILTDDELKLRVVWMISCLIAASSRHCLMKQIIAEHPSLEDIKISDVNKQGKLYTGKDEMVEMRNSMNSLLTLESSFQRTRVPDLSMKLWHMPVLELPETGFLMKGATVIVIRPADGRSGKGSGDGDLFGFDGDDFEQKAFGEAVKAIVKRKKTYMMTMSSF